MINRPIGLDEIERAMTDNTPRPSESREQVLALIDGAMAPETVQKVRAAVSALYDDNERMSTEMVESMQIVGQAITGGMAAIHVGHLPDMCRDLVAERDDYKLRWEQSEACSVEITKLRAERDALRRAVELKNEAMKAVAKYLGHQKFGAYVGTLQNAISYTGTQASDAEGGG